MLYVWVAALAAGLWGAGDFSGGKAARLAAPLPVTVLSQVAGLPVLVLLVLLFGRGGSLDPTALAWSAAGGAAGFAGIVLLYRGLAQGAMALFAPVTAVTAALVPLVVGLLFDRLPSPAALAGAGCAIVAIGLVSLRPGEGGRPGTGPGTGLVGLALLSGLMFGVFFVLVGRAGTGVGMWPVVGVRLGSIGVGLLALPFVRAPLRVPAPARPWLVAAGILDTIANALYVTATASGPLSVVAPVAALYPVSTVLLALAVDRERVHPVQIASLGFAATALVLVVS